MSVEIPYDCLPDIPRCFRLRRITVEDSPMCVPIFIGLDWILHAGISCQSSTSVIFHIYIYNSIYIYMQFIYVYMYIYIYSYITTYIYITLYIYILHIYILYISLGEVPQFARFSLSRQIKPFPPSATPSSWPPPLTARATPPKPQPDAKFARSVRARFAPWGSEEKLRCSMN